MKRLLDLARTVEAGREAKAELIRLLREEPQVLRNVRDTDKQDKVARMAETTQEIISLVENGRSDLVSTETLVRVIYAYATLNGDLP